MVEYRETQMCQLSHFDLKSWWRGREQRCSPQKEQRPDRKTGPITWEEIPLVLPGYSYSEWGS